MQLFKLSRNAAPARLFMLKFVVTVFFHGDGPHSRCYGLEAYCATL